MSESKKARETLELFDKLMAKSSDELRQLIAIAKSEGKSPAIIDILFDAAKIAQQRELEALR